MIFEAILFFSYLLLQSALKTTAFIYPSFKKRLMERDLSFVMTSNTSHVARLFRLNEGNLSFGKQIDGFINFSVFWNGWGSADTLSKKMHLHPVDLMNTGIITFGGDLSSMDYLLVLLGEMVGCFKKMQPTFLKRA